MTITADRRHEAAAVRRQRRVLMHGQAANQQTAPSARGELPPRLGDSTFLTMFDGVVLKAGNRLAPECEINAG